MLGSDYTDNVSFIEFVVDEKCVFFEILFYRYIF